MPSDWRYNPFMQQARTIRLDGDAGWSRAPGPARWMLQCHPMSWRTQLIASTGVIREWADPLEALHWMSTDAREYEWIGYLSYDVGRWFESIPVSALPGLNIPLFCFTAHDPATAKPSDVPPEWREALRKPSELEHYFTRDNYEQVIRACLDYISAGDVFQINLSQRFVAHTQASPRSIYANLCAQAPAQHGALLEYENFALICNSPELFLRVTPDRKVITRPIKGTRPRKPGMEQELLDSEKDQAELNMIVDLERNDLGRVCEIGSVHVIEPRTIEAHPTVYHGVATVEGKLREGVSFVDLLAATFPGGSITGAPKIRAMEIIEELEPVRRGPYCGAIGHLSPDGTIELNVAIRTMIAIDGKIHIPVGGGIVADSDPGEEYEETLVKAHAMLAALGVTL